ncbi:hypothetical protein GE09DRAFT_944668 [Coniochaeta sp. 2T2.1]|nr:hypothetical protein GE09DRAFT_944668 [Coniochaeta sp. 2T2.1]
MPATSYALEGSILITGAGGTLATSLISKIVSRRDLCSKYYGIYAARDVASPSSSRLHSNLQRESHQGLHQHEVLELDLLSLKDVRDVAARINWRVAMGEIPRIRVLVLNAGVVEGGGQRFSEDGFDGTFQVVYLGHWLLTMMLLESMDPERGRVVVLGSWAHDPEAPESRSQGLYVGEQWQTFVTGSTTEAIARGTWSATADYPRDSMVGLRRYGAAKCFAVMMMHELQKRLDTDPVLSNISVLAIDPGWMATNLWRDKGAMATTLYKVFLPVAALVLKLGNANAMIRTVGRSADDVLRAAFDTSEPLGEHPKAVYLNGRARVQTSREGRDERKQKMLWRETIGYARLREGDTALRDWRSSFT